MIKKILKHVQVTLCTCYLLSDIGTAILTWSSTLQVYLFSYFIDLPWNTTTFSTPFIFQMTKTPSQIHLKSFIDRIIILQKYLLSLLSHRISSISNFIMWKFIVFFGQVSIISIISSRKMLVKCPAPQFGKQQKE